MMTVEMNTAQFRSYVITHVNERLILALQQKSENLKAVKQYFHTLDYYTRKFLLLLFFNLHMLSLAYDGI